MARQPSRALGKLGVHPALVWNELIRPTEEADLASRFGEPYQRYGEQVRCWIPTPPWHPA